MENRSAAYERLSQDDGDKQESESIRSQRALIQQYVDNNPALHLVAEYADDGWSGTNFDRPDFKRMMDDAAKGRINCIIVKDLSRFGRNYIGMGKYMERILPSMGVRLIAINDNYDSAKNNDSDSIIVPFKNLINDSYSRDISTKIRSQLDVKRKRGDFIGNYAAYGYKRDENDHNRLVVDEYAAGIVRDIFNMKMEGLGCQTIADRLNERGVLSPMEYHRLQGVNLKTGFRGDGSPRWTSGQISPMLRNRVYIGTMQQGKRRKTNYKMKQLVDVPEEEWICVEGTH
ncbi:MAG: recombinase family protein, partial [Clostridiales bacterium]|nr:recombinase family protein [Clostridiales bacterium]